MRNKLGWLFALYRFLVRKGPFDVFHAHVDAIVSGPALAVAAAARIPVRIAHNHAARLAGAEYQKLRFRLREAIGNAFSAAFATARVAISDMAMEQLAGRDWRNDPRCRILLYGFDYTQFRGAADRVAALRANYGIAVNAPVIGHIGRFDTVKNHTFMLDAFALYLRTEPAAKLVLIGRGPLQEAIEAQARTSGIADAVIFAGGTDDVAAYLKMFDVFAFPSFSEGLGIVILEAQAAGTPVLMSDNMPREVVVVPECITELPLAAGAAAWAKGMAKCVAAGKPDPDLSLATVENSVFGMDRCLDDLNAIYSEQLKLATPIGK
jgi:glycosyltransferase involved in cell wall biosynthesis